MKSFTSIAPMLHRKYPVCLLAMTVVLYVTSASSQSLEVPSSRVQSQPFDLQHVVNIIGVGDLKSNGSGHLLFTDDTMTFAAEGSRVAIPLRSIQGFSIAHDNVALIGGAKGAIAGAAPYGVGQVISAIRPAVDTLTLVYRDDRGAIHGAVLLLPKGKGDDVIQTLGKVGLTPRDYPQAGPIPIGAIDKKVLKTSIDKAEGRPSLRIALLTESVAGIPAAFPVGVYEELVAQLGSSGLFRNVWRQGDDRAESDALTLHVNIRDLKKGSARARSLVPLTGATVIKADVQLTDAANNVLFDKQIDASRRLRGENMTVTTSLGKKIKSDLVKLPDLKSAATKGTPS